MNKRNETGSMGGREVSGTIAAAKKTRLRTNESECLFLNCENKEKNANVRQKLSDAKNVKLLVGKPIHCCIKYLDKILLKWGRFL